MTHILVVDDNDFMRSLLREMLERSGFKVMEASDGNIAIRLHKNKPADLIIMDLIMPEKEGLETIMELVRDFPGIKIIAISGGGHDHGDTYLGLATTFGAACTIAKPFLKENLLEAIEDLLE